MEPNLKFRKAEKSDLSFLLALRTESMNPHILNAGLTPNTASHLERINYCFDCAKIIILNSEEVGLLKVVKEGPVWDLTQIQLTSSYRGLGIGKYIVEAVLREAFSCDASVKLSVYKNNPAKKLYESVGFKVYLETEKTFEMQVFRQGRLRNNGNNQKAPTRKP